MKSSRRAFLAGFIGTAASASLGQGVSARKSAAQPRGKPSGLPWHSNFSDIASHAGLVSPTVYGFSDHKDYIVETLGCGCAFLDYDNDGWLDIFLLSGTRLGETPPATTNRLFKNNRDGTFKDVTAKSGLYRTGWACGVCVGDYNNDANEDLFVTYWGQNVLYRNNGDGTFSDVTRAARLEGEPGWSTGCTFLDYDRDGNLDLFVARYLDIDLKTAPRPGVTANCRWMDMPVSCGPRGFPFGRHSLYRNNGDGTFTDVTAASGIDGARTSYGLTAMAADLDDDGWPDIFVACDSTPSLLLLNNHDGTFREEAALRGLAYSEDGQEQAGMGCAVGDYDRDGRLDIFKTNFEGDTPDLYHNLGKGSFEEASRRAGLAVENRYVCWGTGIQDFDNDGLPDIFAVAGHTFPEIEKRFPDFPAKDPRLLFRNLGNGRFEELLGEAGPALTEPHNSRGCAFGDFDNDGDVDILVINLNEPPSLLRNDVSGGNSWIKVKLVGTKSNRSAIGAQVVVRSGDSSQTQEVQSQSSFLSANDSRLHFGLGQAKTVEIKVRWPAGQWESVPAVNINQLVTIKEGSGIVRNAGWKAV
ncbi:MAG: CRTAC1 family protein [Acidobacteria bacterium]|nr:CRTAC1 family protein [Acidobacteriota bacterium]MBV9624465.1 CRTAC1 family protein [Acidobacteriota bacterium]